MHRHTWIYVILFLIALAGFLYFQDRAGQFIPPIEPSSKAVLFGDAEVCNALYTKAISDHQAFGFTNQQIDQWALFADEQILTAEPFPGEISVSFPAEFTTSDSAYTLSHYSSWGIVSFDLVAGEQERGRGNLLYIVRPGDYTGERVGLEENRENVNYFDTHELGFFEDYAATPPTGTGVTTCLIRESNDFCRYIYLWIKQIEDATQYSLNCYMLTDTTVYSIISNAVYTDEASDANSQKQHKEWNDLTVRLLNHIRSVK